MYDVVCKYASLGHLIQSMLFPTLFPQNWGVCEEEIFVAYICSNAASGECNIFAFVVPIPADNAKSGYWREQCPDF
jgi:hypothetical protein